jgi:hypothetical protein
MVVIDITQSTSIHLLYVWPYLNLLQPRCFLTYYNINLMWGLLVFLLIDSSVHARRPTTCLSISNCFPLCRRIAYTLPTHHELASTPFNMLVAFIALTTLFDRPIFCLPADFKVDGSLVMLHWPKCTPQSYPIHNKLDPHEDLAWRQLSWLLNCMLLNSC